jgi:hypothetical protein
VLGCEVLKAQLATTRDGMRAEQVVTIANAVNMPIEDVALCRPDFLELAERIVKSKNGKA